MPEELPRVAGVRFRNAGKIFYFHTAGMRLDPGEYVVVETIRGWGSYIINPHSKVDALVEAPHPFADAHTPEIGGRVFAECEAKGFLLAGAHRAKADVPSE